MVVNRATIEVTLDCEQSLIFVHSWWNKNIERREREYQASDHNHLIEHFSGTDLVTILLVNFACMYFLVLKYAVSISHPCRSRRGRGVKSSITNKQTSKQITNTKPWLNYSK